MTGPLSKLGRGWEEMAMTADEQVAALRRKAREMADALDREAMLTVEGAADRRNLQDAGNRYAD